MNYEKPNQIDIFIKAIGSGKEDKIIKVLDELKKIPIQELILQEVFRTQEFTENLVKLVSSNCLQIQNKALNIIYSYSHHQEFILKVHSFGLHHFILNLKFAKSKVIQQKIVKILCRQMIYEPSKLVLYENNIIHMVIPVLKTCETDEAKYYGIKALRMLSSSSEKLIKILNEKGLLVSCNVGLSLTCPDLCQLTMQYIMLFIKKRCTGSSFYEQVVIGTDNLQTFKKIYEQNTRYKYEIFEIFLTIFSHHFSCTNIQQYSKNVLILDYLCMANFPIMIVNELSLPRQSLGHKLDRRKIIKVLCNICELSSKWRKYSFNVLPTYHDRAWMQISCENGIPVIISLLAEFQDDKELLRALLRAILGLENLHSNKFKVLQLFMEANILLIFSKIFDKALKTPCGNINDNAPLKCKHYNPPLDSKRSSSIQAKLIPSDLLDFIAKPSTSTSCIVTKDSKVNVKAEPKANFKPNYISEPDMVKVKPIESVITNSDNHINVISVNKFVTRPKPFCNLTEKPISKIDSQKVFLETPTEIQNHLLLEDMSMSPRLPITTLHPVIGYKEINKIKFRTGNKNKQKRNMSEDFESDNQNEFKLQRTLSCDSKPSGKLVDSSLVVCPKLTFEDKINERPLDDATLYWIKILEYLVRILHQIFVFKEDIKNICKEFLPKVYQYISKVCVVHESANQILAVIAKNTSCIQYVLDSLFIPMLVVDLQDSTVSETCSQCGHISKGINLFLKKIGFYFSHFHQYGRCEIANRLNPSKEAQVKNSSLVAMTHVVKCPQLLYDFLIEHRGLDQLLSIFSTCSEAKIHLYGVASVCSLLANLKDAYGRKHYNSCIFCETNAVHLPNDITEKCKAKKKQMLMLTCSTYGNSTSINSRCNLTDESNKNCIFKLNNGKEIAANRELLSMRNEVLKTMLLGSFSESLENCVEIKDINYHVMEMVVHFTYGCTCDIFFSKDATTYVELLFVAQMYFIPELQILAIHYLSVSLCSERIYSFLDEFLPLLNPDLLQHLFCSLLSQSDLVANKINWIDSLLTGKESEKFFSNVSTGITNVMKQVSSLCNCDVFYEPIH